MHILYIYIIYTYTHLYKYLYSYLYIHVRSGDTYNPDGAYKQKSIIATTKFTSRLVLMGPPPIAIRFSQRSDHHRSAPATSTVALFLATPS